jgi:hypothetical protein
MERIEPTSRTDRKVVVVTKPRVSFGAIVAGVVVALATLVLLGFLGIAIGGAAIEPALPGVRTLAIATALWVLFAFVVATGLGSLVAGRLSGVTRPLDGLLHGVVVFGLTLFLLVGSAAQNPNNILAPLGAMGADATRLQAAAIPTDNEAFLAWARARAWPGERDKAILVLAAAGVDPADASALFDELGRERTVTPEALAHAESIALQVRTAVHDASRAAAIGSAWAFASCTVALFFCMGLGALGAMRRRRARIEPSPEPPRVVPGLSH